MTCEVTDRFPVSSEAHVKLCQALADFRQVKCTFKYESHLKNKLRDVKFDYFQNVYDSNYIELIDVVGEEAAQPLIDAYQAVKLLAREINDRSVQSVVERFLTVSLGDINEITITTDENDPLTVKLRLTFWGDINDYETEPDVTEVMKTFLGLSCDPHHRCFVAVNRDNTHCLMRFDKSGTDTLYYTPWIYDQQFKEVTDYANALYKETGLGTLMMGKGDFNAIPDSLPKEPVQVAVFGESNVTEYFGITQFYGAIGEIAYENPSVNDGIAELHKDFHFSYVYQQLVALMYADPQQVQRLDDFIEAQIMAIKTGKIAWGLMLDESDYIVSAPDPGAESGMVQYVFNDVDKLEDILYSGHLWMLYNARQGDYKQFHVSVNYGKEADLQGGFSLVNRHGFLYVDNKQVKAILDAHRMPTPTPEKAPTWTY